MFEILFCSSFEDIFDVDHFISVLSNEVSVVKELPSEYSWSSREYYATGIRATRIKTAPVHASANWYLENVLPVLQRCVFTRVDHVTKTSLVSVSFICCIIGSNLASGLFSQICRHCLGIQFIQVKIKIHLLFK